MIYLILAVTSSALVSIIMRVSGTRIRNNITMLACNYLMCSMLAAFFTHTLNLFPVRSEGFPFSLLLGGISGILYLGSFILLQWNIRKNGIILSSTFIKLGVMVPTLMAILFFREVPQLTQVLGFLIALVAILMINLEKGSGKAASAIGLVLLLIGGGSTDGTSKIYQELGEPALKDHFLLYIFLSALILCIVLCFIRKQGICRNDVIFGLLIGIPNYFSSRFLLFSLAEVPAVIAYPSYSVATILVVTMTGLVLFKEKLSRRQTVAMLMIFAALILLNI